jgi:protein-tyrosine phosphatase
MELDQLRGEIARLYARIAEAHAHQLSELYQTIAEVGAPILIHCTAGKDRTGVAVAILLELVGVPRGWVVWDYEQTNRYLKKHMVNVESVAAVGAMAKWLNTLGPEGRDLVLGVDRSFLLSALNDLDQRFGSIEAFARVGLGLSENTLDELRRTLLVSG